jgi:non-specific serine/threonine protein kinase
MATSVSSDRSVRNNLPAPLTSFIGRERELAEVQARLADSRLLTLTGVGGCGKTRLALAAARSVLDRYPDGVWLVELGPLADPALVAHSVATVVGVRETAGQSTANALAARLRDRRLLLLLDNCEHLLDICARLVDALLRACPDLHVLATSREALGITGEIAWRVPSLAVPDLEHLPPLRELHHNPAVRLFAERALAVQPSFAITERNAAAVAQVCARLDGIPLALELAAARVAALTAEQLAARLDQRFRLLTGGSRAALPRQQTLRATLDWSHDLLSGPERRVLSRLSVFAGGWTVEAAEAVCAGDGIASEDVLDLLVRLVSKSLVLADESAEGAVRYRLLETVRQYARERLVAANEAESVHLRHAMYFLEFVEALNPQELLAAASLWTDRGLLDQLERELDNLRAALRWWIELQDTERAIRQADAVFPIWFLRGSITEGRGWLEELLALAAVTHATRVRMHALPMLANLARRHGEYEVALDAFQEMLSVCQAAGDRQGIASTLGHLANVHYMRADFPAAWACLEASRTEAGELADPGFASHWHFVGGQIALHEGRYDLARTLLSQELAAPGPPNRLLLSAYVMMNLGTVARAQGNYEEAESLAGRALEIAAQYGDKALLAHVLEAAACQSSAIEQHERALCLSGAATALREAMGAPLSPAWRHTLDQWLEVSRTALTAQTSTAAFNNGQAMSLQEAIEYARASSPRASGVAEGTQPIPAPAADPLTQREQEVAALVAQGLTNRQIASRLVITERTVAAHIEHILNKLRFASRTQIGVWMAERGLVILPIF